MSNIKEIWKVIEEFPNYEVSSLGNVRNSKTEQELSKFLRNKEGGRKYLTVNLYDKYKHKTIYVHRLVAKAFISNPDNKCCVNHIDGVKTNNNKENLEWVTSKENSEHAVDTGLTPKGIEVSQAKLTESDVYEIMNLLMDPQYSFSYISKLYHVDPTAIKYIYTKRNWKHLTKDKNYPKRNVFKLLSDNEIDEIVNIFKTTDRTDSDIAADYNVTTSTINAIRNRRRHSSQTKDAGDLHANIKNREDKRPYNATIDDNVMHNICNEMATKNTTIAELSRKYNVAAPIIYNVYAGKSYTHISKHYKFKPLAKTKLTEDVVHNIINLFLTTKLTNVEIADRLGVHSDSVKNIRSRKSWTNVSNQYKEDFFKNAKVKRKRIDAGMAEQIAKLLEEGELNSKEIASKLNVGYDTVKDIKRKRIWKDLANKYNY